MAQQIKVLAAQAGQPECDPKNSQGRRELNCPKVCVADFLAYFPVANMVL